MSFPIEQKVHLQVLSIFITTVKGLFKNKLVFQFLIGENGASVTFLLVYK